MTDQMQTGEPGRGANPAQIKGDIDAGETGDKTPGFDPGAAPLGTDEEAAGPVISPGREAEERRRARIGRPEETHPNAATPELAPDARQPRQARGMATAAAIGILAALILAVLLYLAL